MMVYRVIEDVYSYDKNGKNRNEFRDYQNGIISFPKDDYNDGLNTHKYKQQINYLHFFHFYESALEYVFGIPAMGWDGRCFIALYNIPEYLLAKYIGFGLYPESLHPNIPALEYAIPFSELDNSFIQGNVIQYNVRDEFKCSEDYKKYMEGNYVSYLENIDEFDRRLIKSLTHPNLK